MQNAFPAFNHVACEPDFCEADNTKAAFYSAAPSNSANKWTETDIAQYNGSRFVGQLGDLACTPSRFCIVDKNDGGLNNWLDWTTKPEGTIADWQEAQFYPPVDRIACSSDSGLLCTGVFSNGDYTQSSADPLGGASTWGGGDLPSGVTTSNVSCPSTTMCVAVTNDGHALTGVVPGTNGGGGGSGAPADPGNPNPTAPTNNNPTTPVGANQTPQAPIVGTVWGGVVIQGLTTNTRIATSGSGQAIFMNSSAAVSAEAFETYAAGGSKVIAAKARKPKTIVAGHKKFTLKANVKTKVTIALTKPARKVIAKKHKLKVTLKITAKNTATGQKKTTTYKLTLVLQKKKTKT